MTQDKKLVDVKIHGNKYSFSGFESEEYIKEVCAYVDCKIKEIARDNKELSSYNLAVLSAVNISDEYHKRLQEETMFETKLKETNLVLEELRTKLMILEKENDYLRQVIDSLKERA